MVQATLLDGAPKKAAELLCPIFDPFILWSKGWMHQDATSYGGRPQPRRLCVRWAPSASPQKGDEASPSLRPMCIVAKLLHRSRFHLV